MTQKEILEWALSGIETKKHAMIDGYKLLNKQNPKAGSMLWKIYMELCEKQDVLELMLAELKEEK